MEALRVLAINFTNLCNLSCVHCGRQETTGKLKEQPVRFFENLIEDATKLGLEQVNITGGEIFVRPDALTLVKFATSKELFVSIETNGVLVSPALIDELAGLGRDLRVSFSLDGFDPATHDAIRGRGSFNATMKSISYARQCGINTRVISVLHKGNRDQILPMARHFDSKGIGFRLLPNIIEYGKGVYACNTYGVSYTDAQQLLGQYYQFLRDSASDKHSVEMNIALLPVDIQNFGLCPWGLSMLGVNPEGIASLCHVSEGKDGFVFGDLKEKTIKEVWENSDALAYFRNLNPDELKGVCGNCLARKLCRGACRFHAASKYDDLLAPDPQCQAFYDLGYFPKYALEDETRNCSFRKE